MVPCECVPEPANAYLPAAQAAESGCFGIRSLVCMEPTKLPGPAEPTPAAATPIHTSPPRLAVSYTEAARLIGCNARTIWSACASGELRAARIGRRRVISMDELQRWLEACSVTASTATPQVPKMESDVTGEISQIDAGRHLDQEEGAAS